MFRPSEKGVLVIEERGKVYLVEAGPGDIKLITLKALDCIREAHVIAYDHLVNPELLFYARPEAEIIYVGKKSSIIPWKRKRSINYL